MSSRGWPEADLARLRALWASERSTAAIGVALKRSKGAVIGMAHRLKLPPRPSPIRRVAAPAAAVPTPSQPIPEPVVQRAANPGGATPRAGGRPSCDAGAAEGVTPALSLEGRRAEHPRGVEAPNFDRACCWPLGEPRTPGFRWCEGPVSGKGVYCAEHAARARARPERWHLAALNPPGARVRT